MTGKADSTRSLSTRSDPSRPAAASKRSPDAKPAPGLYLVATPIGNLGDIGRRALDLLARADVVACEDTRVTRKLLTAHGIQARLIAYHEHNAERVRPRLIEDIKCGKSVALVADAGTPLVSDPGYRLVTAAVAADLAVTAVPGPSAALAALLVSGLPTDRFLYAGFLPNKAAARRRALDELAPVKATLIVFESARRLPAALADMAGALGPRPAAVARELTKLHEEVRRDTLPVLAAHYQTAGPPKGEVVVVVGPPEDQARPLSDDELDEKLREALGRASVRDAVAEVARETGVPRQRVYARALALNAAQDER